MSATGWSGWMKKGEKCRLQTGSAELWVWIGELEFVESSVGQRVEDL